MTNLHSITASYTPTDEEAPEIEVTIYYTFTRGYPATGPTYWNGGEPGCPAEVELDHIEASGGDGSVLAAWAAEYLRREGYDLACEQAAEDLMPDPDAAYEARREGLRKRYEMDFEPW